ncbi:hypothetical protein [Desulforamulus aeronauticus]|uniref:Haemolysin XhlA n=1 Tax=Desulforamulus aeronauticus DSM 10349 TaxID=1121421 RepID=A0A1M6V7D6_9FIRM|nr:hypothetical protein [Desulforamulus aeronauticus]SHK77304.1 hypothetical protein SAMN02745123_03085 [Desulforamulus aeronauticus DSM 10349]
MSIELNLARQVSTLEADVGHLKQWQERQAAALERLAARQEQILMWLLTLMGGVAASLILLIINLQSDQL